MQSDAAERILDRAEQVLRNCNAGRRQSETSFLLQLIRELGGQVFAPGLSPAGLYRGVVHDRVLIQGARNLFKIVAMPSKQPEDALRAGDWMIRVVPGTGDAGHISVLASDDLLTQPMLESEGISAESAQPGYYGLVIEAGAFPHTRGDRFARRLLDSRGRVAPNTVFLRPSAFQSGATTENTRARRDDNGFGEDLGEQAPRVRFRTVFYDRWTLRYLDGWTRETGPSAVFLIDRSAYDPIRADGAKRGRELDGFLAQSLKAGRRGMDLMPPMFVFDPTLATVPLNRASRGDWDDLMIGQLIGAGHRLTIQNEADQWKLINRLFAEAEADARKAAQANRMAREFAAHLMLDISNATLSMVEEPNVTMRDGHAEIPIDKISTVDQFGNKHETDLWAIRGGGANARVIGDIHTHYLLDPLIDLNRTSVGTTIRSTQISMHSGVSDVDVDAARHDHLVKYAVDSKYLHRANPNGTKNDELPRSGDVLREALRVFGGESEVSSSG
jgi:hypothetical protein